MKRTLFFAAALAASVAAFAQDDLDSLEGESWVDTSPTISVLLNFGYNETGAAYITLNVDGDVLANGDTIAIGLFSADYELYYPYDASEPLDLMEDLIEATIEDADIIDIGKSGLEYFRINNYTYWFNEDDRKAIAKRAYEVFYSEQIKSALSKDF